MIRPLDSWTEEGAPGSRITFLLCRNSLRATFPACPGLPPLTTYGEFRVLPRFLVPESFRPYGRLFGGQKAQRRPNMGDYPGTIPSEFQVYRVPKYCVSSSYSVLRRSQPLHFLIMPSNSTKPKIRDALPLPMPMSDMLAIPCTLPEDVSS